MRTRPFLLLATVLAGCAQSHGLPRSEYCDGLLEALCAGTECCSNEARRYPDATTCMEDLREECRTFYEGAAFDEGLLVYDPERAQRYVDGVMAASLACDRTAWDVPNPFVSTGVAGTSCEARGEDTTFRFVCGPGLGCRIPGGICTETRPRAVPCTYAGDCLASEYCLDGACLDRLGVGAPCPAMGGTEADRVCLSDHCNAGACAPRRRVEVDEIYCMP